MKKILLFLMLLAFICLSACQAEQEEVVETEGFESRFGETSIYRYDEIITDEETGCKYLFIKRHDSGGLTNLYDENGELYCGKEIIE